jgi:hypothetical protein
MAEKTSIILDFGTLELHAQLNTSQIAGRLLNHLPCTIKLQQWGNEYYGAIGTDLGEENPVPTIPEGGLAYTRNGNYLCIFYGQKPAWPVEYIGQINNNEWQQLAANEVYHSVTIRLNDK